MKRLSQEARAKLEEARIALESAVDEARTYADDKSDRWRESDAGISYETWIESMEELAGAIEDLPRQPE